MLYLGKINYQIKNRKMMKSLLVLSALILLPILATSQTLTGDDIIKRNQSAIKPNDEEAELTLILENKNGHTNVRSVKRYLITDQETGKRKTLIEFLAPADVKGTRYLSTENVSRNADNFLYMPDSKKHRRVCASDDTEYFMGSDYTYEDILEDLEGFAHRYTNDTIINDINCYVVETTPNNPQKVKTSGYSKRVFCFDKVTYLMIKAYFYDKNGVLSKIGEAEDIKPVENSDQSRAHKITMINIKTSHKTQLIYKNYKINQGVNPNVFTLRYLDNGI